LKSVVIRKGFYSKDLLLELTEDLLLVTLTGAYGLLLFTVFLAELYSARPLATVEMDWLSANYALFEALMIGHVVAGEQDMRWIDSQPEVSVHRRHCLPPRQPCLLSRRNGRAWRRDALCGVDACPHRGL